MQSAATRLADNPPCSRVGADQHGHPARRSEHVTYADSNRVPGWERDHCLPLGLGGAAAAGNVWYQPIAEAQRKDLVEHEAIEMMCRGQLSLDTARSQHHGCKPGGW
jgi:hypothetical protein